MQVVPWYYILFLIMAIIVSAVAMSKQYDYSAKNKNWALLSDLFLYFIFGLSLGLIAFGTTITWLTIIGYLLIALISTTILAVLIEKRDVEHKSTEYTKEGLLGKKGTILNGNENGYIGILMDETESSIIVKPLNGDTFSPDDIFMVVEIAGNEIIAKKIGKKQNEQR